MISSDLFLLGFRALRGSAGLSLNLNVGTQKAHKHKHSKGISLPCWVSCKGGLDGISLSYFFAYVLFGAL